MIPLLHDFTGETVLVVGGGAVGARKARRFDREADVLVLGAAFSDEDVGDAQRVRTDLSSDEVDDWLDRTDPALVVAATDDETLNDAVAAAARDRDVLYNRADEAGERPPGSVVVPATVRDDSVVVSVATGGRSPALSRALRERIEPVIDGAGEMAALTADLRAELKEQLPAADRRAALRAVVRDEGVWKALDNPSANTHERVSHVISDVTGDSS